MSRRIKFEITCHHEGDYHVVTGIGANGFIVFVYPSAFSKEGIRCLLEE